VSLLIVLCLEAAGIITYDTDDPNDKAREKDVFPACMHAERAVRAHFAHRYPTNTALQTSALMIKFILFFKSNCRYWYR
jgi:hypothetical protein